MINYLGTELPFSIFLQRTKRKKGRVLFNDALNTFFNLRLYGVRHMVKDHSDSEKGNPLPPHGLLFPINSNGSFICTIPHTTAFDTPVVEHWLEWEIAQWVHHMKDRSDDPSHHERTLLPRSYISLPQRTNKSNMGHTPRMKGVNCALPTDCWLTGCRGVCAELVAHCCDVAACCDSGGASPIVWVSACSPSSASDKRHKKIK